MPRPMTEQERQRFLTERHIAVLSVASDSERPPLTVPVWYGYQPGSNLTMRVRLSRSCQVRRSRSNRLQSMPMTLARLSVAQA